MRFISIFTFLILCFGCSPKQENVVRINIRKEPPTLDPHKARDLESITLAKMLFEGLTRINKEERAELALAERVSQSDDGRIYTFTLRKAQWSDLTPIVAGDFVKAWKMVLEPHFPADQAFQMYVIKNAKAAKEGKVSVDQIGVKALDDQTLQVELQHAVPYFLELTALPVFFPVTQKENPKIAVGNGPFLLKEWKHNDCVKVVKNPTYWDAGNVKLKAIDLIMVNETTELQMYEKGELDWAGSPLSTLPVGSLGKLKQKGLLQMKPFLGTYFYRMNTASEPFQHPLMRKAFAGAIKRSEIVEHVTQGGQLPATALLPPSLRVQEKPYFADGNIAEAKANFEQALQAMGLTRETLPLITLTYVSSERNHLIAQAVQEQWRNALGITVELQAVEGKVFFDRISKKNFQIAAGDWIADFNDGINFLEVFKFKTGSNNTAWENLRYRELLDQAKEVFAAEARQSLFRECETILMKEMPIIPIYHHSMLYLANPKMKDVVLSNLGSIDFKWAFIDESKQ